jgi:hypothetical protein
MTTKHTLRGWFAEGLRDPEITHMIVKWDTYDGPDANYPIYVRRGQDPREVAAKNKDRTVECYSMELPWETQAEEFRARHWEWAGATQEGS